MNLTRILLKHHTANGFDEPAAEFLSLFPVRHSAIIQYVKHVNYTKAIQTCSYKLLPIQTEICLEEFQGMPHKTVLVQYKKYYSRDQVRNRVSYYVQQWYDGITLESLHSLSHHISYNPLSEIPDNSKALIEYTRDDIMKLMNDNEWEW